jgi:hypothetical protein
MLCRPAVKIDHDHVHAHQSTRMGFLSDFGRIESTLRTQEHVRPDRKKQESHQKHVAVDAARLKWVSEALRQSQQDERRCHTAAVARLETQYDSLQNRIEAMYLDRLDGRIDTAFFDRKASEWRNEQSKLTREIQDHRESDRTYLFKGVRLLEIAGV